MVPSGNTTVSVFTGCSSFASVFSVNSASITRPVSRTGACSTTASPASDFTKSRFILSSTLFTFAASSENTMISENCGFFLSRMTTYKSPLDLASPANSRSLSWGMVKNFMARCSFNIRSRLVFPLVFFWSFSTATISTARFFAMLPLIRRVCSIPSMEYRTI